MQRSWMLLMAVAACRAAPPEVVVFALADNFGHYNTGFSGNKEARTPTLDALAASGVRLTRMYAFKFCSPSRSAFLSGRLPYHVNPGQPQGVLAAGGVDVRMATIANKMQEAGLETVHLGKWHVGQRSAAQLPKKPSEWLNRGFNHSLGFLTGAENHFTQHVAYKTNGDKIDLWQDHGPAPLSANAYGTFMYADAAIGAIEGYAARKRSSAAAASKGLFLFLSWQDTHAPLQVPRAYCYTATSGLGNSVQPPPPRLSSVCPLEAPPGQPPHIKGHSWCFCYDNESSALTRAVGFALARRPQDGAAIAPVRFDGLGRVRAHGNRTFSGGNADLHTAEAMARILDEGIGNVTRSLRRSQLWERTLFIFSSDNGGPLNAAQGSGNNFSLRGGKHTSFEGGVRVLSVVAGGWLEATQPRLAGTSNAGVGHIADWFATLCGLFGVDASDAAGVAAGVPAVDSFDLELPITMPNSNADRCFFANGSVDKPCAFISGQYKVVTGRQGCLGYWTGRRHPNATLYDPCNPGCPAGCLFDLSKDSTEHNDLRNSSVHAAVWSAMAKKMNVLAASSFSSNSTGNYTACVNKSYYDLLWRHHRGPACFLPGRVPTLTALKLDDRPDPEGEAGISARFWQTYAEHNPEEAQPRMGDARRRPRDRSIDKRLVKLIKALACGGFAALCIYHFFEDDVVEDDRAEKARKAEQARAALQEMRASLQQAKAAVGQFEAARKGDCAELRHRQGNT